MADITEKTIASELRKAAALLRETAITAVAGPWASLDGGDRLVAWRDGDAFEYVADEPIDGASAEWMALVNPLLAEPLASWLEDFARWAKDSIFVYDEEEEVPVHESDYCDGVIGEGCQCFARPLAVARALNGATS